MTKNRWNYLKALTAPAARIVHEARVAWMQRNPLDLGPIQTMPLVPMFKTTGGTYNVGRNAEKRRDRKADIKARAAARRA